MVEIALKGVEGVGIYEPQDGESEAIIQCFVPAKELAREDIPFGLAGLNPRTPKKTSNQVKAMLQTIRENPTRFKYRNGGCIGHAEKFTYNGNGKLSAFDLALFDGEHTRYSFLEELRRENGSLEDVMVALRLYVNVEDDELQADMACDLNDRKRLASKDIADRHGRYEWIKAALVDTPFDGVIRYNSSTKKRQYDISDFIGPIISLNRVALSSDDSNLGHISHNADKGNLTLKRNIESYARHGQLIPGLLRAYEYARYETDRYAPRFARKVSEKRAAWLAATTISKSPGAKPAWDSWVKPDLKAYKVSSGAVSYPEPVSYAYETNGDTREPLYLGTASGLLNRILPALLTQVHYPEGEEGEAQWVNEADLIPMTHFLMYKAFAKLKGRKDMKLRVLDWRMSGQELGFLYAEALTHAVEWVSMSDEKKEEWREKSIVTLVN